MQREHIPCRGKHRPGNVQFKAWIPMQLKADFAAACVEQRMTASAVLRALMLSYIQKVENGRG